MGSRETCTQADHPRRRICLACDNRHGCRTPEPLCLRLERAADERPLGGQALMARRQLLAECESCELFRRCWAPDDYLAKLGRG